MNIINYKVLLHNFCQQNKYTLPSYTTQSYGSPSALRWESRCCVQIDKIKYVFYTKSKTKTPKKNRENRAAFLACTKLGLLTEKTQNNEKVNINISKKRLHKICAPEKTSLETHSSPNNEKYEKIYIIDLENKPQHKNNNLCKDSIYIGFLSTGTSTSGKYPDWKICQSGNLINEFADGNNRLLCVAKGCVTDLADHYMTAFVPLIINFIRKKYGSQKRVNVYIVSEDHAGLCTASCFRQLLEWKKITNVKVKNVFHIH